MSKSKKQILATALLCTLTCVMTSSSVSAEETKQKNPKSEKESLTRHYLAETVVEGQRNLLSGGYAKTNSSLGMLGEKQIMEVPFTLLNLSNKTIETFGGANQPL